MIIISCLSDLLPGEAAVVERILPGALLGRRLAELGLTGGTRVKCELAAPSRGPKAYRIRGALIALRLADARTVIVRRCPAASHYPPPS